MGIGGIRSVETLSGRRTADIPPVDSRSRKIENDLTNVQRQKQELSSQEDISAREKIKKRQELQQEISSLNTQLRQRQAEIARQEKQKELLADVVQAESQRGQDETVKETGRENEKAGHQINIEIEFEDKKSENADRDAKVSGKEMESAAVMDSAMERTVRQGQVIARIKDGIAILKGEIRQDKSRGIDVEEKQTELRRQEEKLQRASASQASILTEVHKAVKDAAEIRLNEAKGNSQTGATTDKDDGAAIRATNFVKDRNQAQQFYVSISGQS